MATRLEPYRDYSEHEVINLFSLAVADNQDLHLWGPGDALSGDQDAGVIVSAVATAASLPGDLPGTFSDKDSAGATTSLRKYLGASGQPHVGFNAYPVAGMNVEPSGGSSLAPLGVTLKQTLAYDENDENLLRYPLKKDELQAVLPGQVVPILTRGLVLLNALAFETGATPAVGEGLDLSTNDAGTFAAGGAGALGKIVAVGVQKGPSPAGAKYLCKISF